MPPSGHAAVHEARIAGPADVGSDAEAFGDARPVALDQDVGPFDEPEHEPTGIGGGPAEQPGEAHDAAVVP